MGTVAHQYAEQVRAMGHESEVYSPSYGTYSGQSVHWLRGLFSYGNAALVPSLMWKLRETDVIHLHYPFYGGDLFVAIAAAIWRKPLVVTYHMKTRAAGWLGVIFQLHRWLLEPFILRRANTILVSSLDYAESVGLNYESLRELPFGVDTERFLPASGEQLRNRLRIAENETVFTFVGGMDDAHYFKGIPVLLKALARLPYLHTVRLVLVGDGNKRAEFENLASTLGLRDRVIFAGKVSDEELPDYYRIAQAHILPSIDRSEAFGLVTLEAAASGIPSIVTDLPGVRTLVEQNNTGLKVGTEDVSGLEAAMRAMIESGSNAQQMGINARNRIERLYSNTVIAKKLQDIYEQVTVNTYEDRNRQ